MTRVRGWIGALLLALPVVNAKAAISGDEVRIGLITDLSSTYRQVGLGAVIAAEMAIEDFGGKVNGKKIRLHARDHKLDAETGMRHAKDLHENEKVDLFIEMVGTNVALPIQRYARENGILAIHTGSAASLLTGAECSPTSVHWSYDTYALAAGAATAIIEQGGDSWYFIAADYSMGRTLQAEATGIIERRGGKVLGTSLHPLKATDFSRQLAAAARSGAKVIALASVGDDAIRVIRQADEFGIGKNGGRRLAGLLITEATVQDLGQLAAQGLQLTTAFYWNYDEQTRAWSKRFRDRSGSNATMFQASVYSALMHYFKAVEAAGTDHARAVIAKMRALPVNDFFARNGKLREDGRLLMDMYLLEVKRPQDVAALGDYYRLLQVIPGAQAFRPLEEGGCPYLSNKT